MALTMKGKEAELRVGYQSAARLGQWEMDATAESFTLRASVLSRDDYWMDRGPLDLRLTVGRGLWRWRGVVVSVSDDGTAIVQGEGRPEVQ